MEFEVFNREVEVIEGSVKNNWKGRKEVPARDGELEEGLESLNLGNNRD